MLLPGVVASHNRAGKTAGDGPTHGIEIDASNTGPRVSTTASGVPGGIYTMNQSFLNTYNGGSPTFTAKSFDGVEWWGATAGLDVFFVDCVLDGCNLRLIPEGVSNNGTFTFDHCYIYGTINPYANPTDYSWSNYGFMNASHVTFLFCDVEGFGEGTFAAGDDILIEDCYIHDPAPYQSEANGGPPTGTHHGLTTLQGNSCSDVVIRRCHYKAYRGTPGGFNESGISAALTCYNDSYHPGPIVVEDCYFAGGGVIATYWGGLTTKPEDYADNITATGNIFGREIHRYCGDASPAAFGDFSGGSGSTWSGNTWGALGPENVGGDPAEGATVTAPVVA